MSAQCLASWFAWVLLVGAVLGGVIVAGGIGPAQAQPYGPYWHRGGFYPRYFAPPLPPYYGYPYGFGYGPGFRGGWYGEGWYRDHGPDWHIRGGYN